MDATITKKSEKAKTSKSVKAAVEEKPKAVVGAPKKTATKTKSSATTKKTTTKKTATVKKEPVKKAEVVIKPQEAKKGKKILFVASEVAPYSRTGGLGDVAGALPAALQEMGDEVVVVSPLYSSISPDYKYTMNYLGSVYVPLAWRYQYCGVFEHYHNGVRHFFIDNEYYFKREGFYGHYDDGEKFAFFSRAVLEIIPLTGFVPDIIHCNDWHSALTPVFLDCFYRHRDEFKFIKTVFTIHNIEFQGQYDNYLIGDILGISEEKASLVRYNGNCNYMKGGIECSNVVTTVSNTYANEILDPYFGYGLENILKARSYKLRGVINGIDTKLYNPKVDPALFANYDIKTIEDKKLNKKGLCEMLNLHYDESKPMICMVTRLTSQKGLDLVAAIIDELLGADIQLVILGTGEWKYETLFTEIEHKYCDKFKMIVKFSPDLASKMYAAADIFLMPSRFEPCGLSQLIAMRYGAVPVVRETGGLKDTVKSYEYKSHTGNGFTFYSYNANDMLHSIWNAVDCFYNKKEDWKYLVENCMNEDYSWEKSAKIYDKIYSEIE